MLTHTHTHTVISAGRVGVLGKEWKTYEFGKGIGFDILMSFMCDASPGIKLNGLFMMFSFPGWKICFYLLGKSLN